MKIIIDRAVSKAWFYKFVGDNGEILVGSELLHNKTDARQSIATIIRAIQTGDFTIEDAKPKKASIKKAKKKK